MPEKRNYHLKVHGMKPKEITIDGIKLIEMENNKELEKMEDGWYFTPGKNITYIKVKTKEANSSLSVYISKNASSGN